MKVGILAAGEGLRLQAGGFTMPKPLLPVGGIPLIGHLLRALRPLEVDEIVCIINTQGDAVATYARQHYADLPLTFIQRDTAHSAESFIVLCQQFQGESCLMTTVDALFAPALLPKFWATAQRWPEVDMWLTLTTFIEDEKPLYASLDDLQRITQLGDAARQSCYITSGLYICGPKVMAACAALPLDHVPALRALLTLLLRQGYWLQGYLTPKMIDVDRPEDLMAAEQFIRRLRPPATQEDR